MMEIEPLSPLLYTEIVGFVVALFFTALFSFLETSITALRLFKLKELANSTTRYKALLTTLEKNPHQVLVTILVACSLANVTAAALITTITEEVFKALDFSGGLGFSIGIALGSLSIIIFGEVIPKNIGRIYGERFFPYTLGITNLAYYLLYPIVQLLLQFSNIFVRLFGGSLDAAEDVASEREIKFMINYVNEKGLLEAEKTQMLQSIFNLSNKYVEEIMIPLEDVIMISAHKSIEQALETFSKYRFSRLPVYTDEHRDNVIGMLYQKDLFSYTVDRKEQPLKELMRPILFVPESMRINQLLREFKKQHMHISMVINEHGSIVGIVTLEDVLEEIVGEIRDEYEQESEKIIILEENNWLVDGTVDLKYLEELLKIAFNDVDNAVTVGGFMTESLQHLPIKGERFAYKGYIFQVQKASAKRVIQVLIFKENAMPVIPAE